MDRPLSLAEFLAWRPPAIRELIGSGILIPEGKIEIFGPYKSWKSMTAMDLGFHLATGTPWLGFPTTLSTTLVIQLEIPVAAYYERVAKYSNGNNLLPSNNLHLMTMRNLKLDKAWGAALLEQWIGYTKAQVVIIDPTYKVISGRLTDEFDVRQLTDRLDDIIDKTKASIVLIHHEGKDQFVEGEKLDRGADASFGSAAFGWWVDSQIELRRLSETEDRIKVRFPLLRIAKDNIRPFDVTIDRSTLTFTKETKIEPVEIPDWVEMDEPPI